MKILTDFDGVLTNLSHEARRVAERFSSLLSEKTGMSLQETTDLLEWVRSQMNQEPHLHGWRVRGRITAFWNEDGFIENNAIGACLDALSETNSEIQRAQRKLVGNGHSSFCELAKLAFDRVMEETASGKIKPIDPLAKETLETLLNRGYSVVVVSNSGTERIERLLDDAGLTTSHSGLRIRGHAKKFNLSVTAKHFSVGPYEIAVDRPDYQSILEEELPDVVIGDVFSLDLALPLDLVRKSKSGFEKTQILLRQQAYTPPWSLSFVKGISPKVNCGILERFDQLLDWV